MLTTDRGQRGLVGEVRRLLLERLQVGLTLRELRLDRHDVADALRLLEEHRIRAMLRFCTFSRVRTSITSEVTSSWLVVADSSSATSLSSSIALPKSSDGTRRTIRGTPPCRRRPICDFSSVTWPAYLSTTFCTSICARADVVGAQRHVALADQRLLLADQALRTGLLATSRTRRCLELRVAVGGQPSASPSALSLVRGRGSLGAGRRPPSAPPAHPVRARAAAISAGPGEAGGCRVSMPLGRRPSRGGSGRDRIVAYCCFLGATFFAGARLRVPWSSWSPRA